MEAWDACGVRAMATRPSECSYVLWAVHVLIALRGMCSTAPSAVGSGEMSLGFRAPGDVLPTPSRQKGREAEGTVSLTEILARRPWGVDPGPWQLLWFVDPLQCCV